jgi:light-regulated signal transduction histidine kinase (bacteriophytochrome)
MTRVEKTIFISYRRTNLPWALAIFQNLKSEGYDVFFDYLSIPSGDFENIIVENIKARAHFVVILTPSALERCNEPGDWLRREIETAMDEKRNIIPLMLESFDFGSPSTTNALTGKLEKLKKYNGLRLHSEYFFEGMERLRKQYLNVSLDAVVHPLSDSAKQITKEHQDAASDAKEVNTELLLPQEVPEEEFAKFYSSRNPDVSTGYIDSFLRDLVAEWEIRKPEIKFYTECQIPSVVQIKIHEKWLTSSLNHIIRNAVTAVGDVTHQPKIIVRSITVGNQVRFEVNDNGRGIPKNISGLLFKEVIPEKANRFDGGRGLLITRFIVEQHGGRAYIMKSDEGDTIFAVELPIVGTTSAQ